MTNKGFVVPLKGILIIGKDPINHKVSYFEIYKDKPDYLIIDGSQELMTREEFNEKLQGHEIDSNTRVDILAHGSRVNEREDGRADHSIALLSDAGLTKDVLGTIAEHSGGKPIQAHLWSCYSGTAASAVEDLPEGSVVMGHGPEKSVVSIGYNIAAIHNSIVNTIKNETHNMSNIGQDLVDNIPSYIKQDLNIGIKGHNSEVETFHLDEASPNLSEVESIRGLFKDYSRNIISGIGSMKERGLLSEVIETPVSKTYDDETIKSYEYDRTLFDLFLRSDVTSKDTEGVDFSKILRDGSLISQKEGESLDLNERERKLLDPEFQRKLLDANQNGYSYLHNLVFYNDEEWKNRNIGIDYLIAIAKSNNRGEEYLSEKNANGRTPLIEAIKKQDNFLIHKLVDAGIGLDVPDIMEDTPLLLSLKNRQEDLAKILIKNGADLNKKNILGDSAISEAVSRGNVEIVGLLLDQGADINMQDGMGNTPLILAARVNNIECLELLLERNANLNATNDLGETALQKAITNQASNEFIELLLKKGADVNINDRSGDSILSLAIRENIDKDLISKIEDRSGKVVLSKDILFRKAIIEGDLDSVKKYIEEGVSIDSSQNAPMPYEYLSQTDNPEVARLILNKIQETGKQVSQYTKFSTITSCKNLKVSKLLYENFTETEKQNFNSNDISHCKNKDVARYLFSKMTRNERSYIGFNIIGNFVNEEVLSTLVSDGRAIDMNAVNQAVAKWKFEECKILVDSGYITMNDLMMEAVKQNKPEYVALALKEGADVNCNEQNNSSLSSNKDLANKGVTPLEIAIKMCNNDLVKILVEAGADVDVKDQFGNSALAYSASNGSVDIMKTLIDAGADVNVKDMHGVTPLEFAVLSGDKDLVKILVEAGSNVNAKDQFGNSVLAYSSSNGRVDIMKMLIEAGADVNVKDMHGVTPLEFAVLSGDKDLVKILVESGADVNAKDQFGNSVLSYVTSNGNVDIMKTLIDAGADVNVKDRNNNSILSLVIMKGNVNMLDELLQKGADVNQVSEATGMSPLHEAARSGNKDIYNRLIQAGANIEVPDRDGKKPSEYLPEVRVATTIRSSFSVQTRRGPSSDNEIETKNPQPVRANRSSGYSI